MVWHEISIKVPWEYVEPISHLFGKYGRGLSIENAPDELVLLRTYLPNTSKRRLAWIQVGVNLVRVLQPLGELEVKELDETDWQSAWKAHFSLMRVGNNLVVKPSWIDYEPKPDDVVIELDPGMAFGTGYHPTTKMCLEALEGLVRPGMKVLDLGTGSGILTIAAARLGAAYVLALDIDPVAVKEARKNFKAGGFRNVVRLARGTVPHSLAEGGCFDLAMANISARIVQERAPHLREALKPGGILVASGYVHKQQHEVAEFLVDQGFSLEKAVNSEDWATLVLYRDG